MDTFPLFPLQMSLLYKYRCFAVQMSLTWRGTQLTCKRALCNILYSTNLYLSSHDRDKVYTDHVHYH